MAILFFLFSLALNSLSAVTYVKPGMATNAPITPTIGWDGWLTIGVLILLFIALLKEIRPPDVLMLIAAGILGVAGVISPRQLLIGFSNDVVLTIALLCIVVRTWQLNGLVNLFTQYVMPKTELYWKQLLMILVPVAAISGFMNNTVIILMMTPAVITWAIAKKLSPSKYLIPISYASIVGGLCTLIGTSTNLIVDGLLRQENPTSGFTFFELGAIGVPLVFITIITILLLSPLLLPDRKDLATAIAGETREFTGEFEVEVGSPFVGKSIQALSGKYFPSELIVEIERDGRKITSPSLYEEIHEEDRIVFAGDINAIAHLHTIDGLSSVADPHFKLDVGSSHFSEVVVTPSSFLVGKSVKGVNFRNVYGASVFAVYRNGKRLLGNVGDIILDAGDTLVMLSTEEWKGERFPRDFYSIRYNEALTIFKPWRAFMVLTIALGMVLLTIMGTPLVRSVLAATIAYILTRSITLREAKRSIVWSVLLLIASSFAVAKAVETTGVAAVVANGLLSILGTNPYVLMFGILCVLSIVTEVLSNNTTALLMFPIVWKVLQLAGYDSVESLKTAGVAVAVGSSCAFSLPTGYQTHMIIYGPGGYKFTDFLKMGIFLNLILIIMGTIFIPRLWPLVAG